MSESVCIVGLGLIGGSLGMALRRRGWTVTFNDPAVTLQAARDAGAADDRVVEPRGTAIVLATPADVAVEQLKSLAGTPSLVTSVCSLMQPLHEAAGALHFVAGHPFAGSEESGLAAARADLFEGRTWFLERHQPHVERMIADVGAFPVVIDPAEHDRIMALTSHLPQLVSTALGSILAGVNPQFIGTGSQSLLRLAGSSYEVWRPVLEANSANVGVALEELIARLREITAEDFARANLLHERLGKER